MYSPLSGNPETPGAAYAYGLKLPSGFLGHYCFNAPAELTIMKGKLTLSSSRLRTGERRRLNPGVVYSVEAELPSIVLISATVPWPTRNEPGAPIIPVERC
jgi:hypothetical protein